MENVCVKHEIKSQDALLQNLQHLLADIAEDAVLVVALHPGSSKSYQSFVLEAVLEQLAAGYCAIYTQVRLSGYLDCL